MSTTSVDVNSSTASSVDESTLSVQAAQTKGIHAAAGGWYNSDNGQPCNGNGCPAIDILVSGNTAFFGSVVILNDDLGRNSGRCWPAGCNVSSAMQYMQSLGSRIIVRLYRPEQQSFRHFPTPQDNVQPSYVKDDAYDTKRAYPWIRDLQIHNEPNLEWPASCTGCKWHVPDPASPTGTRSYTITWYSRTDPMFYSAISWWYDDVLYEIQRRTNPEFQGTTWWAPPLAETFNLINGQRIYDIGNLPNLIVNRYGRLNYHVYPAPNYDSVAGRIINNSWREMPGWLQNRLDGVGYPRLPSIIPEYGWNPGQMDRFLQGGASGCNQYGPVYQFTDPWPTDGQPHPGGTCLANDGAAHSFYSDIVNFFPFEMHGAQVLAVWLVRSNNPNVRDDGLDGLGFRRAWLDAYQRW